MCWNCIFWTSKIAEIDFTENLSGRKILKFSHCAMADGTVTVHTRKFMTKRLLARSQMVVDVWHLVKKIMKIFLPLLSCLSRLSWFDGKLCYIESSFRDHLKTFVPLLLSLVCLSIWAVLPTFSTWLQCPKSKQ